MRSPTHVAWRSCIGVLAGASSSLTRESRVEKPKKETDQGFCLNGQASLVMPPVRSSHPLFQADATGLLPLFSQGWQTTEISYSHSLRHCRRYGGPILFTLTAQSDYNKRSPLRDAPPVQRTGGTVRNCGVEANYWNLPALAKGGAKRCIVSCFNSEFFGHSLYPAPANAVLVLNLLAFQGLNGVACSNAFQSP